MSDVKMIEEKLVEYKAMKDRAQARAEKYMEIAKERKLTENEGKALVKARREVSQMHMNIEIAKELLEEENE